MKKYFIATVFLFTYFFESVYATKHTQSKSFEVVPQYVESYRNMRFQGMQHSSHQVKKLYRKYGNMLGNPKNTKEYITYTKVLRDIVSTVVALQSGREKKKFLRESVKELSKNRINILLEEREC